MKCCNLQKKWLCVCAKVGGVRWWLWIWSFVFAYVFFGSLMVGCHWSGPLLGSVSGGGIVVVASRWC